MKYKKDVGVEGTPIEILRILSPCGISRLKDFLICLLCSYVYTGFTNGKLIPIIKNAGDLNSSDNYRYICGVGLLSKLFDLITLHMLKEIIDIVVETVNVKNKKIKIRIFGRPVYVLHFACEV